MSLGVADSTYAEDKPRPDARFGNWLYKTPNASTWKKIEKDGALIFSVDLPPGDFCTLTLFAGGKSEADFPKQFAAAVDADQKVKGTVKVEADGGPKPSKSKEGFDVITRSLRSETATLHTLHLYVGGHSGDRFDLAAFQTTGEETWKMYSAAAGQFILSLKLANSQHPAEVEKLVGKAPADAPPTPPIAPTLPTTPPPGAVATSSAAGAHLEVLWAGTWYKATVVKQDGEKRFIRYDGFSDSFNEWVGPERMRAIGSVAKETSAVKAAPQPVGEVPSAASIEAAAKLAQEAAALPLNKGDAQFNGLYLQVQSWFFNGAMSVEYIHYYFFPDGHVFRGVPPGGSVVDQPGAAEFAALLKAHPKNCGTYLVRGDKITFQFPGEKPSVKKFSYEKPGSDAVLMIDTLGAVKVGRFKDDQKLDATYEGGASARSAPGSGPQTFVASSSTFDFHPDGTWGRQNIGLIDSNGDKTGVSGSADSTAGGRYQLRGNTLTLTGGDVKSAVSYTVYPFPDKEEFPPMRLFCNGTLYTRERPKP